MSALTSIIRRLTAKHFGKSIASKSRKGKKSKKGNRKKGKELNENIKKAVQREDILADRHTRNPAIHKGKKQAADDIRDARQAIEGQKIMKQISERQKGFNPNNRRKAIRRKPNERGSTPSRKLEADIMQSVDNDLDNFPRRPRSRKDRRK